MSTESTAPDGLLVVPRDPADPRVEFCRDQVTLKHSPRCTMAFGKLDTEHCARCIERANERVVGLPARADHAGSSRDRAARDEAQRQAAQRAHFAPGGPHARGECGPVCTAFDW